MSTGRITIALLTFCLLLAGSSGHTGLEPPSPTLTVSGRAAVYHGDLAGARERAVQGALVRALEQYAGLRIEASTLISRGELIDREVRAHTHGYVRSFEVLQERREGGELVVRVQVRVAEAPVEESFGRLMSATTTLLLVREANLGEPVQGQVLPAILADTFFTASVVVPPAATLESACSRVPSTFFESTPDPETAKELGLRYLSGIIIVARADTEQLASTGSGIGYEVDPSVLRPVVAASGNLTVLDGHTGGVIAARRFDDVRGSDASDPRRAGTKALHDLAGQMQGFVVEALSEYVASLGFTLRVEITGPAAAGGAPRVRQVLEATRWVTRVDLAEEEGGETVLQVVCSEKPVYIVEELRQAPEVRVQHFNAAAATVKLR